MKNSFLLYIIYIYESVVSLQTLAFLPTYNKMNHSLCLCVRIVKPACVFWVSEYLFSVVWFFFFYLIQLILAPCFRYLALVLQRRETEIERQIPAWLGRHLFPFSDEEGDSYSNGGEGESRRVRENPSQLSLWRHCDGRNLMHQSSIRD